MINENIETSNVPGSFHVDWNDGRGGTSNVISYSYPAGADPTQPLVVTHVFNAGIASPNVTATAVDSVLGSFTADPQPVTVTPVAPANVSTSHSGASITVGWTNASNISTGTTILISTDDVAFFEAGGAATGATGTTISNLNLDTNYWVEALTEGANGESTTTTPQEVSTNYSAPSLVIIPSSASPLQGQGFSLNLSATYPDNTPQKDLIGTWTINWDNGSAPQNYSGQAVTAYAPSYAAGTLSANISITATDSNNHTVTHSQTMYFSPHAATGFGGSYNNSGTRATLTWLGPSDTIASEYIIQQISPGAAASGWQTIATVAVSDNVLPDYGYGLGYTYTVNSLAASSIGGDGGYLWRIGAKTSDATSDIAGTPGVALYMVATAFGQNPIPSGPGNLSGVETSIVAGGEVDVVLSYGLHSGDNPSGTVLTVKSYNPDVVQPTVTTVTLNSSGGAILPVMGLSVGNGKLIVQDSSGDEGIIQCGVTAVGVSSTGNDVEGGNYNSSNMPGFTFFIDGPSATPVVVNCNTGDSTLPQSWLGNLSNGSVTIPAGETSAFVPLDLPDEGEVEPVLVADVELTETEGGGQAVLNVSNNDQPLVTMKAAGSPAQGASNNAVIPLDPQGDNKKLTDIHMSVAFVNDNIYNWTLTWNPDDFVMWPSDHIGTYGVDDLASIHIRNIFGSHFDSQTGLESYTGFGDPPQDVYGQCISGSADWNATRVQFSVTVDNQGNAQVAPASGTATASASGTANGPEILFGTKVVTGVKAADMLIGQGLSLTVLWAGPINAHTNYSEFDWNVPGGVSDYFVSDPPTIQGIVLPIGILGNIELMQGQGTLSFYWASQGQNGSGVGELAQCSGSIFGNAFSLWTGFDIYTPSWLFGNVGFGKTVFTNATDFGLRGAGDVPVGTEDVAEVSATGLPASISVANASWNFIQLVTPDATWDGPAGKFISWQANVAGLDQQVVYPAQTTDDPATAQLVSQPPVDGVTRYFVDSPGSTMDLSKVKAGLPANSETLIDNNQYKTFLMFKPAGDSIRVPLGYVLWHWNVRIKKNADGKYEFNGLPSAAVDAAGPTARFPTWTYVQDPSDVRSAN